MIIFIIIIIIIIIVLTFLVQFIHSFIQWEGSHYQKEKQHATKKLPEKLRKFK